MHAHSGLRRPLLAVLALNTIYLVVEAVAGWWTNSLALLSDAGHMLGDVGALALSFAAASVATRPASIDKTYGYYRSEILATLANGVALVTIAALVMVEGVRRLGAPPQVEGGTVAWVAGIGLAINLASAGVLYAGSRHDLNVRGAFLHALSDALGSIGALTAGLLVVWRGWVIADPIASLFIGVLVLVAGVRLLGDTVHVLMEGVPSGIPMDRLRKAMERTDGVRAIHDLHVWSVTSRFTVLSAHVVTERELTLEAGQEVLARLRRLLEDEFQLRHITIQLEPEAPPSPITGPHKAPAGTCLSCEQPAAGPVESPIVSKS